MDVSRNQEASRVETSAPIKVESADSNTTNSFNNTLKGSADNLDNATNLAVADMSGKISSQDLNDGKRAMDGMMNIIREAATATGAASDGKLTQSEVLGMNHWIRDNKLSEWTAFHGDDENNSETGFHKWQGDGGKFQYEGEDFVNTVLDGINHLGFEFDGENFLNEDGDANASLADMTDWLNTAYFGDFAPGITIAPENAAANGGAQSAAAAENSPAAREEQGVAESPTAADAATSASEPTAAEVASGFPISEIDSLPEWLQLLAEMLGLSPEEVQGLLEEVLNDDGTIDKEKLAAKLEEKGMDPEMAATYAAKISDSFDELTAEGGELEGLSKDEIIAQAGASELDDISDAESDGINSLVNAIVSESQNRGGSFNPQTENSDAADSQTSSIDSIMNANGYREDQEKPGFYNFQAPVFA